MRIRREFFVVWGTIVPKDEILTFHIVISIYLLDRLILDIDIFGEVQSRAVHKKERPCHITEMACPSIVGHAG